jgi:hypothetical protein
MTNHEKNICLGFLDNFVLDGKKVSDLATPGQLEIFYRIVYRRSNRVQIITPTQYGKSLFVALGCIIVSCIQDKVVAVVAPKTEKAKIIMRYYIEHLGDNPIFYTQLEKDTKLERLRMEENKERIILRNGGGIFVISANASNSIKGFEAAMGSGAELVVIDEASLIPDEIEATIFRMIAGKKDGFYCKIGNPFYRNHFLKSWNDANYDKVFIDYQQGLNESRYAQEFIDEAKRKPHFDVLFACQFPKADSIDAKGYSMLLTEDDLKINQASPFGEKRLGVDVAEGGGNYSVVVIRYANFAKVLLKYQSSDTMDLAGRVVQLATEHDVQDRNIFIDSIGVGKGVLDRLREQRKSVHEVKGSERAEDDVQFVNKRAENYWELRKWIKGGGTLSDDPNWVQLMDIKYKAQDSSGKLLIQSKDEQRREGIDSPDVADALSLTFARKSILADIQKKDEERSLLKEFDFHRQKKTNNFGRYYGK